MALAPAALFYLLDAYYLMLERRFRKSYNTFVEKVHPGKVRTSDLYAVTPKGSVALGLLWSMFRVFLGTAVLLRSRRHGPVGMAIDPVARAKVW